MAAPQLVTSPPPDLRVETGRSPWERWAALGLFVAASLVLIPNVAPGVSFHDSGEFALAAHSGGIPHSPGAPTWSLLAWIFSSMLPFLDTAHATNILSSLYAAGSVAVLHRLCDRWIRRSFEGVPSTLIAFLPALILLGSAAFLEQAFITEQYTLLLLILGGLLLKADMMLESVQPKPLDYILLGLLFGLAVGNHPSQVVLGPYLLAVAWLARGERGFWRACGWGLIGILGGLSIFLYLPLRASTNPLMNWGHPNTPEQLWWTLTRQQWRSRPFEAAPAGFTAEWFKSYNLTGEVGWMALLLAAPGAVWLWLKAKKEVLLLLLAVLPYSAILLVGHLRQMYMDLTYIRHYGVMDWHLPLYAMVAVTAAVGLAWLVSRLSEPAGRAAVAGAFLLGGLGAGFGIWQNSMSEYTDARKFVELSLQPIPERAIVMAATDNVNNPTAYERYARNVRSDIFFGYGYAQLAGAQPDKSFIWSDAAKERLMSGLMYEKIRQPLTLPRLSREDYSSRRVFTEFMQGDHTAARFMLPAGWFFEMVPRQVTNQEVVERESQMRRLYPELFVKPPEGAKIHRLSREAWSQIHKRRGAYFVNRGLPKVAEGAFLLSLAWEPEAAGVWFGLGYAQQADGRPQDAAKSYLQAIDIMPDMPGPRLFLATILVEQQKFTEAEALLQKELTLEAENRDQVLAALAGLWRDQTRAFYQPDAERGKRAAKAAEQGQADAGKAGAAKP